MTVARRPPSWEPRTILLDRAEEKSKLSDPRNENVDARARDRRGRAIQCASFQRL